MREWASKRSNLQFDWCLNFYWSALQWNCVCNCIVHWHWLCVIVGCRHALVHSFKCITFLLTLARVCLCVCSHSYSTSFTVYTEIYSLSTFINMYQFHLCRSLFYLDHCISCARIFISLILLHFYSHLLRWTRSVCLFASIRTMSSLGIIPLILNGCLYVKKFSSFFFCVILNFKPSCWFRSSSPPL